MALSITRVTVTTTPVIVVGTAADTGSIGTVVENAVIANREAAVSVRSSEHRRP